jgi:hypothetical protein
MHSKKGESMFSVAHAHGLSIKQLGWYNPKVARLKNGNLVAGQVILVPTHATVRVAADVPDPALERYPRRAKKPVAKRKPVAAATMSAEPAKKKAEH